MSARFRCLGAAALFATLVAAASGADMDKVLHVAFVAPENGFDPQATGDLYSNYVNRQMFDPLYRYDRLARPYKIVPNTAAALPEISADGMTWTIRIKPGIYFADDPAFKGKKRELVAEDYVYSFKRLIDPKLRSNNAQILDDRLVGAKAAIEAARKSGAFDYDAPLEGAQAIDRYTLRLKLTHPAYDLLTDLRAKKLPNGPERVQLYREMSKLVVAYAPWVLHTYRIENIIVHPWVLGYKYDTFDPHPWMYLDLDLAQRRNAAK